MIEVEYSVVTTVAQMGNLEVVWLGTSSAAVMEY
jgi:hypothetical protein